MEISAAHGHVAGHARHQLAAQLQTAQSTATAAATNPFPSLLGDDPAQRNPAQPAQAAGSDPTQATAPDSLAALLSAQEQGTQAGQGDLAGNLSALDQVLAGTTAPQNAVLA